MNVGQKVKAKEVEDAVKAAGITRIEHHDCSICGHMTYYSVDNGNLFYHPGCYCGDVFRPKEPRTWSHAAEWINMQSSEYIREKLMLAFGLNSFSCDVDNIHP